MFVDDGNRSDGNAEGKCGHVNDTVEYWIGRAFEQAELIDAQQTLRFVERMDGDVGHCYIHFKTWARGAQAGRNEVWARLPRCGDALGGAGARGYQLMELDASARTGSDEPVGAIKSLWARSVSTGYRPLRLKPQRRKRAERASS